MRKKKIYASGSNLIVVDYRTLKREDKVDEKKLRKIIARKLSCDYVTN